MPTFLPLLKNISTIREMSKSHFESKPFCPSNVRSTKDDEKKIRKKEKVVPNDFYSFFRPQKSSSSTSYRHGPWRNCVVTGSRERDKDSLSWLHDCQMKKKKKRKDHRRRLSNKWEVNELNLKITIKVRHANIKERNGPWSSTETGYGHATLPIIRGPAHKFTNGCVYARMYASMYGCLNVHKCLHIFWSWWIRNNNKQSKYVTR